MPGLPASPPSTVRLLAGLARPIGVLLVLALLLSAGAANVVRIKRGDTLTEIAQRYHTTVAALRQLNDIPGNSRIYAGQTLRLPRGAIDSTRPRAAPKPRPIRVTRYHTVVRGDTLIGIAARYRTSVSWVQAANKLPRSRVVILGDRLVVGFTTKVVRPKPAAAPRTKARTPRPRPVPRDRVRALIRREAKRAGVNPDLALALAYQESGFQQDVVSHAGAIGVMQVMPETGRWLAQHVVHRPLDLRDVEDNIVAGVRFLALLLRMTRKTPAALAGYYQGLASVKHNGEYADTKLYVRNILFLQRRFARG